MSLPAEVFLSHATADRKFADDLAGVLRAHGVPVWYSRTNLVGAQQWHDEIGHALARCDAFVVVLSPDAVGSQWVRLEFLYALTDRRYRERIVPVLLRPCATRELSWTLDAIQRVDFTADVDQGYRDLLRVWGLGYDKTVGTTPKVPTPRTEPNTTRPRRRSSGPPANRGNP